MKMLEHLVGVAFFTVSILFGIQNASGLGHDFFTNKAVSMPGFVEYPKGFEELVNANTRLSEMVFFFSGKPWDFTSFLEAYSKVTVAAGHRLVLHDAVGEATSPWSKTGQRCDWE